MIKDYTFSDGHLSAIANKYRVDKQLVQKQVAALTLLYHLRRSGLNFIFKGGTSLLCLISPPLRLSLDIDIIVAPGTDLANVLQSISLLPPFKRFEGDQRNSKHQIPKSHFRFYFDSSISDGKEEYILLDVLYEENLYPETQSSSFPWEFILTDDPVDVITPTVNSILGDKLTAFAPNTTGIPYLRGSVSMSMEIIKQLFDISNLFDKCEKIEIVENTFERICTKELIYRNQDVLMISSVLDDIFNTSYLLLERNEKDSKFISLLSGINRLKSYIIPKGFHLDYVIIAAGKAAYLSQLIKLRNTTFERFFDHTSIKNFDLADTAYSRYNKLRKSNPQAFFYWYKAIELK